jgi:hypothetical protein
MTNDKWQTVIKPKINYFLAPTLEKIAILLETLGGWGQRYCIAGCNIMLQDETSRALFPMRPMEFFNLYNPSNLTRLWSRLNL